MRGPREMKRSPAIGLASFLRHRAARHVPRHHRRPSATHPNGPRTCRCECLLPSVRNSDAAVRESSAEPPFGPAGVCTGELSKGRTSNPHTPSSPFGLGKWRLAVAHCVRWTSRGQGFSRRNAFSFATRHCVCPPGVNLSLVLIATSPEKQLSVAPRMTGCLLPHRRCSSPGP
jgi:hypothetical protein